MATDRFGVVAFSALLVALFPLAQELRAQSVPVGGQTCTQNYTLYDYYTNGVYQESHWEPDGVTCSSNGGGAVGAGGGSPGGGVGGGGGGDGLGGDGIWVEIAGGTEVNLIKSQVRNNSISCYDDGPGGAEVRAAEVGRILVRNPALSVTKTVTAIWSDGKQTYRRIRTSGSTATQMAATSGCF